MKRGKGKKGSMSIPKMGGDCKDKLTRGQNRGADKTSSSHKDVKIGNVTAREKKTW